MSATLKKPPIDVMIMIDFHKMSSPNSSDYAPIINHMELISNNLIEFQNHLFYINLLFFFVFNEKHDWAFLSVKLSNILHAAFERNGLQTGVEKVFSKLPDILFINCFCHVACFMTN